TRLAIVALALLGLGDSAYLAYEHFCGPIVCIGSGCALVDASIYSDIFGVPLSVLGLLSYSLILGLALASLRTENPLSSYLHLGVFGLALTGVIFGAYLTYLEFSVIRAFCTWCMVSAVNITAIFGLAAIGLTTPARAG
ncbi:MAG: vitamin K epoxide reductase family protein, partial [Candidatus Bipolaricaulia bacterium]